MAYVQTQNANSKWNRIKDALKEGLTPKKAKHLEIALENTKNDFVRRQKYLMENASASAVSTGNIATLNKVILPIIRRVLPNVIVNELIGVQPMPGPVAQIMTLRYVYGNTSAGAGVLANEEMLAPLHVRDLAASYSGNEVEATPAGALTAQLEGVPGNAVKLEMLKQVVEAKSRRLSARWTVEAQTDAQNQCLQQLHRKSRLKSTRKSYVTYEYFHRHLLLLTRLTSPQFQDRQLQLLTSLLL